jgi:hypothetical protein
MFRKTLVALALAVAVGAHPGVAQARGGGRIPCLSEEVIKVADVPRDAAMALAAQWGLDPQRIRPGYGLDLGYRFQPCSAGGRWVGYIGYSEADFDLDDQQAHQLAAAAGLSDLPPTPGIWKNPDILMLAYGFAGASVFLLIRLAANYRSKGLQA